MVGPIIGSVVLVVVGITALAFGVEQRRERPGRDWPARSTQDVGRVLLTVPGAGLMALGGGIVIAPGVPDGAKAAAGTLLVLPGVALILLDVFWRPPTWWVPRWAREAVTHRREVEKRNARNRKRRSRR